jgi:hypothetical protein
VIDDFLTESCETIDTGPETDPDAGQPAAGDDLSGSSVRLGTARPYGSAASGHDGGDAGLVEAFVRALVTGDTSVVPTTLAGSLASHLTTFAAERARLTGQVVGL